MPRHAVDGLRIETDVNLEGLPAVSDGPVDWHVDLTHRPPPDDGIEWTGTVSHEGVPWVRFGRRGTAVHVLVENWGTVVASKADRRATVHVDAERDADSRALRRAMPYLVALSGGFVLHAACVVVGRGAVVLAGESGVGKSTLALAFDAIAMPVLSDDHVALRRSRAGVMEACTSFPAFEVAPAACAVFRPDAIGRMAEEEAKVPVLARTPRPAGPVPVTGLCFLRRGNRVAHEPIARKHVVPLLFHESSFLADPADRAEHAIRFDAAAHLAASVPSTLLTVPEGMAHLTTVLDLLMAPFVSLGRP